MSNVDQLHDGDVADMDTHILIWLKARSHYKVLRCQVLAVDLFLMQVVKLLQKLLCYHANFPLREKGADICQHVQIAVPLPNVIANNKYATM